ncbi:MAG: AraC family transcriptional regulator [Rhizomicrobium sp.]|jgi:AraC-like DNA-binding protein
MTLDCVQALPATLSPSSREVGLPQSTVTSESAFGLPILRPDGVDLFGREPYSRSLARLFKVDHAQTAVTTSLKTGQIAVTRLTSDSRTFRRSSALPAEKAYIAALQLRSSPENILHKSGRRVLSEPFVAGSIVIAHLEDEPAFDLREPFDMLVMHIPSILFDELASEHGAPRIGQFADQTAVVDPVAHDLGRAILPLLSAPRQDSQLLFEHIAFAIHARLASQYGIWSSKSLVGGASLNARQERAVKEILTANLSQQPPIAKVAQACGLSVSKLIRAFRNTTGMPPHRWLRSYRVERAKDLLLNSGLALGQIAYDCGFSDQSHFTRVFSTIVGATPGAWRRARRG